MKKQLLSLGFSILSILLFAQNPMAGGGGMPKGMTISGRIYGKVVDATTKKPIEFASVVAFRPLGRRDSIIGGMLSLENGDFNIDNLPIGGVKIKISLIGYKDFVKMVNLFPPDLEVDLGNIGMAVDAKVLNTVEVTAEKAQMQLQLDKKVFNVDKNITATGGTAEDVLKNVPSVTVDADGSAKLRNSNTTIYVDGRPTLMSINQIPADQIEQIEVITNPSSKFEAQTSGGIINIVLKKNRKPGYNGIISAGIGTQNRYNGMFNINIKQGRWNSMAFYNVMSSMNPTEGYTYRTYNSNTALIKKFNQDTKTDFNNLFQIARLQTEYSIDNRNALTVSGTYVAGKFDINSYQDYQLLTQTGAKLSYGERDVLPQNRFVNYMAQANWKRTYPKKGKELVVDLSYGFGGSSNEAMWTTSSFWGNGQEMTKPVVNDIDGGNKGQQVVFQLDYVNPLNDSTKIEWGVRTYWNNRKQEFYFYTIDSTDKNRRVRDDRISQYADINDMINAAYATYSSRWKGINYQMGLRFEQSELTGASKLDNQSFGYSYPKSAEDIFNALFPSIYVSKKTSKTMEWQANFSRKINRPNFMQLMPIIMNNDPLNIRRGNQALQPEFINLAEINLQKTFGKRTNTWLSSVYLRGEENPIVTIGRPLRAGSDTLVTTFENGNSALRYGLDNTLKLNLLKDFDITTNINVFNINVQTADFSNDGWAWNGKANLNWKLPKKLKDFSMQLNANYESDQIIPQGVRKGIYFFDYALKYNINRVSSLTFQINDITNTRREILMLTQPTFLQESMRRRDLRFYRLTFSMPFGKADSSIFRRMKDAQKQRGNQPSQEMDFGS